MSFGVGWAVSFSGRNLTPPPDFLGGASNLAGDPSEKLNFSTLVNLFHERSVHCNIYENAARRGEADATFRRVGRSSSARCVAPAPRGGKREKILL